MGTDKGNAAARRHRSASAARGAAKDGAVGQDADAAVATAEALPPGEPTTLVRRFRRGRWTVTALPALPV